MNWHKLELLVAIAFGATAALALAIISIRTWVPDSWWLRRLITEEAVDFLKELGNISAGLIVIVFILILGGSVVMSVLLRGYEKLGEVLEERKRQQEEQRRILAEVKSQGLAQGRAASNQKWQAWAQQLIEEGKLPSDVEFPTDSQDTYYY